jgi:hypothetical protein
MWRIEKRGEEWFVSFASGEMGPFLSLYQALDRVGASASEVEGGQAGPPLDIGLWQPELEHKFN